MSKESNRAAELAALATLEGGPVDQPIGDDLASDLSRDFSIVKNKPLPEGFENPPCGEEGHKCVGPGPDGKYHPEWYQLLIEGAYEGQANPQKFPLGGVTYLIPLDEWVDAPPCVIESLKSAVETHYTQSPPTPGQIALGIRPERKAVNRKRFVYDYMKSA